MIELFNLVFFGPIVNLLVLILRLLQALGIPGALGFSIILLTLVIRVLIWPFMATQLKSAKKMAELKPHLDELKTKHGKDRQALASAQMALYKEHGVNPAGGCLPALIQIPIVIALYQAILAFFGGSHGLERINSLVYVSAWKLNVPPDLFFLGFSLADKPADFMRVGPLVLLVPIITALLQFIQSKMMVAPVVKPYSSDSFEEKKEKGQAEDAMSAVSSQMLYLMPVMIGYFAFSFPIGLSIYWNTFTVLGIWQQYLISGWGGIKPLVQKLKF